MNPELEIKLAEQVPNLVRMGAEMVEEGALKGVDPIGRKGFEQLLADVAGHFESLRPIYPQAEALLTEPVQGLENHFFVSREAIAKSLDPAQKLLPQLGLHGTSVEGGSQIVAAKSAHAIDFATFPEDSALRGTKTYLSEVGLSTETGVSFSEKWNGLFGRRPGPVFVLDVSAGKSLPRIDMPIKYPYGGDTQTMAAFFPEARQFKGTLYSLKQANFDTLVSGVLDYPSTQKARPLIDLLNKTALDKIAGGAPREQVLTDLWARGNVLSATRRLDLAHQAISKWLTKGL